LSPGFVTRLKGERVGSATKGRKRLEGSARGQGSDRVSPETILRGHNHRVNRPKLGGLESSTKNERRKKVKQKWTWGVRCKEVEGKGAPDAADKLSRLT